MRGGVDIAGSLVKIITRLTSQGRKGIGRKDLIRRGHAKRARVACPRISVHDRCTVLLVT